MDWKKLFNPIAWLKEKLRKETRGFRWSKRETEALIAAGKTLGQISDSESCIHIAGESWVDRTVK